MAKSASHGSDLAEDIYFDAMDETSEADSELSPLAVLPIELFLYICSFLEVRDMVLALSKVCKRFHDILDDENFWKSWIARRWNGKYPIVPVENDCFDWRRACLNIEREFKLWGAKDETMDYFMVNDVHISSVDAVVITNSGSTCISGSRDRTMVVWSPLKTVNKRPEYVHQAVAHEGWIWRLQYVGDTLYSCSWDNTVKAWSLDNGLQHKLTFKCSSPALSMTFLDGLLLAGDFAKTVYAFDPRCSTSPAFTYVAHNKAVLTLGSAKDDVVSGSEDKTLAIWDNRRRDIRQKIILGKACFPNCSYMDNNGFYIGDNKGMVHVFDSKSGTTELVTSFDMGHKKPISVIQHGLGYLLTGSLDGTVKISVPTNPPGIITSIKCNGGEVGGLDYFNGMLAIGSTNSMEFWVPKSFGKFP